MRNRALNPLRISAYDGHIHCRTPRSVCQLNLPLSVLLLIPRMHIATIHLKILYLDYSLQILEMVLLTLPGVWGPAEA